MLLPIALSFVEGCAQSPRYNVPVKYTSAQPVLSEPKDRCFARLASEIFLSSLQTEFLSTVFPGPFTLSRSKGERSYRHESTVTIR